MKAYLANYGCTDIVNSVFFALLTLALTVFHRAIPYWYLYIFANIAIIAAIGFLARFSATRGHKWKLLHGFYMMLCIPIAFKVMYVLVPAIHPVDYDAALIAIDRALFGVDPTQWLSRLQHPMLTEILQIAYGSFYLLPLILVVSLYRRKRMKAFKTVFLLVILGFYLSYLGYVAVPAVGPRFTLHDFEHTDAEVPGLWLTPVLRAYTNTGESIPPGTPNPASLVQRDVFPSGHTQITLLVMILAFRFRAGVRWFLGITGTLLIIATVYLRYHYVIDLVAGAAFVWLTLELGGVIDHAWSKRQARISPSMAARSTDTE